MQNKKVDLLKFNISNTEDKILKIFLDLIDKKLIHNPIIFSDNCSIKIDHVPIFHSFYINHTFHIKTVLIEYNDYVIAKNIYFNNMEYIVLCTSKNQLATPKTKDKFLINNGDIYERLQQVI